MAWGHELAPESVHVLSPLDPQGQVIEPGALAVEAVGGVGRMRGDHPDVGAPPREARDRLRLVDRTVLEGAEQLLVERQRDRRVADVDLEMIELGLHQNFSHFTLFRSMPFVTSTSRTR